MPSGLTLGSLSFERLSGWSGDDHVGALNAFRLSAAQAALKPYRTGSLGLCHDDFAPAYAAAITLARPDERSARNFFERHFQPFRIDAGEPGFVTGFYEPIVQASPAPTADFPFPLLRRPDDLVDIDDGNRPAGMDPYLAFARRTSEGLTEYFDRAAIETGALDGRALEIAWLADRVEAFFIHVQGAARLVMPDGATVRVTYAAKSGQRFTGPGGLLIEMGELQRETISAQAVRRWLSDHPERMDELLRRNRSYIFFREAEVPEPALGPIAAAKVPLTPGRSMAVDRLIHTFGTPFFVDVPDLDAFGAKPFSRLMIAQDTGSAIVGPARGDLFTGSGDEAGEIAGVIRHRADFTILVPRAAAARLAT